MKILMTLAPLGIALGLSACADPSNDTNEMRDDMSAAMDEMPGDGGMMDASGDQQSASSTGTVTAIDARAGKVTLDHAAIAEANWPAMTMEFDARSELLEDIEVGDKVVFDVSIKDGGGEVTAIRK
ncbi:MAG: copper-binding protein [Qipengyuania sp.]